MIHATQPLIHYKKTRLAPTPSGFLHLGNVLSFALTVALARRHGAKILLRIDDMDRERVNTEYVRDIFDTLDFLEIPYDEGPRNYEEFERSWSQTRRIDLYGDALERLREHDELFACTCSRSQLMGSKGIYPGTCLGKTLAFDTPESAWRLKTTEDAGIVVKTLDQGVIKAMLPAGMKNFVVRKKDGFPAYQLTSLVDDLHFGVDLIVRGEDLWPSTLAQLYLAEKLDTADFLNTTFYHHPLLMESAERKLSKSAGAASVKYLREQGKKRKEVYTTIAQMAGCKTLAPVENWHQLADLIKISSAL